MSEAREAFQRAWARVVEAAPRHVSGIREIMFEEWMAFFRARAQEVRDE